jgi:LysM repeat protein
LLYARRKDSPLIRKTTLVKTAAVATVAAPTSLFLSTEIASATSVQQAAGTSAAVPTSPSLSTEIASAPSIQQAAGTSIQQAAGTYVVQPGDTLSAIAAAHDTSWSALAEANHLANPNLIFPGQVLVLGPSTSADQTPVYQPEHTYVPSVSQESTAPSVPATPPPVQHVQPVQPVYSPPTTAPTVQPVHAVTTTAPPVQPVRSVQTTAPSESTVHSTSASSGETVHSTSASSGSSSGSGFQSCVISRESGGNAQVTNSSGHYGLYQFSASTWAEYGGSSSSFGHASVAQQNQVFNNAIAAGGSSNWSSYDGC